MATQTYGYTPSEYKKFKEFAWKMLLSFGLTYMFFYNGRQNINLVMTQMAEGLGSTTAAMGVVSSALFWCYAFGQLVKWAIRCLFRIQTLYDVWSVCFSSNQYYYFFPTFNSSNRYPLGIKRLLSINGLVKWFRCIKQMVAKER